VAKSTKVSLTLLGIIIILGFIVVAIVETVKLSYHTVDEAYSELVLKEHGIRKNQDRLVEKAYYSVERYTFIPYVLNDKVSMLHLEKGFFGWRMRSHYLNFDANGSSVYSDINNLNGETILYGVIPENITPEVRVVKIDDMEGKIFKLNERTSVFLFLTESKDDTKYTGIQFFDSNGNVIGI